jgi:Tfp pilus assembly protein PilZ
MITKERREFARSLVDIPVEFSVQGRFYDGLIKNISKGGVFIETSGTFSVGQEISLYFGKETIIGTVIWVDPKGIGLKFGHRG